MLWVVIIQQAEATGLVMGPFDGVYKLDEGGLDWGSISRLAQAISPPELRTRFDKRNCRRIFLSEGKERTGQSSRVTGIVCDVSTLASLLLCN